MIKDVFIKSQVKKSIKKNATTKFLKRLVFLTVERALKECYPRIYSMKCTQSSVVIAEILNRIGIKSGTVGGGVCVSQIFNDPSLPPSWNGFWGNELHSWVGTQFGEFVDLTIGYLHLHPKSNELPQLPNPSIWWEDTVYWPPIIKYLIYGGVDLQFEESDLKDLELFKECTWSHFNEILRTHAVDDIIFDPILHGIDSLNEMTENGNDWLCRSMVVQDMNIPFPPWVVEKEKVLTREYEERNS